MAGLGALGLRTALSNTLKTSHRLCIEWHLICHHDALLAVALHLQGWGTSCVLTLGLIIFIVQDYFIRDNLSLFECAVGEKKLLRVFSHSSCICLRQSWVRALLLLFTDVVSIDSASYPAA